MYRAASATPTSYPVTRVTADTAVTQLLHNANMPCCMAAFPSVAAVAFFSNGCSCQHYNVLIVMFALQKGALLDLYARSDITTLCRGNSYNR